MSVYKGTTLIAGALPNSANQDLSNLSQTGQAVIDGKADVDLTNVNDTGKVLMSGMGMPSDKYIGLTLGASGTRYTAPANGWFYARYYFTGTSNMIGLYNTSKGGYSTIHRNYVASDDALILPVSKSDIISCYYSPTLDASDNRNSFRFYYAVGSESEAS